MTHPVEFDENAWPLLVVRLPSVMGMDAVEGVIQGFDRVLHLDKHFAAVVDCTGIAKVPGSAERERLTDWLGDEDRRAREQRYSVANVVVLTSGPMRALLTAINWVRKPATPQHVVATEALAIELCCERLTAADIPLSPALAALRAKSARSSRPTR